MYRVYHRLLSTPQLILLESKVSLKLPSISSKIQLLRERERERREEREREREGGERERGEERRERRDGGEREEERERDERERGGGGGGGGGRGGERERERERDLTIFNRLSRGSPSRIFVELNSSSTFTFLLEDNFVTLFGDPFPFSRTIFHRFSKNVLIPTKELYVMKTKVKHNKFIRSLRHIRAMLASICACQ